MEWQFWPWTFKLFMEWQFWPVVDLLNFDKMLNFLSFANFFNLLQLGLLFFFKKNLGKSCHN